MNYFRIWARFSFFSCLKQQTRLNRLSDTLNEDVPACSAADLRDEGADLVLDLHEAAQAPLHDGGEVEQAQRVACRSRVKHHHGEVHPFY